MFEFLNVVSKQPYLGHRKLAWTTVVRKEVLHVDGTTRKFQSVREWTMTVLIDYRGAQNIPHMQIVLCTFENENAETGSNHQATTKECAS